MTTVIPVITVNYQSFNRYCIKYKIKEINFFLTLVAKYV